MKVYEESKKAGLKLNIKKKKTKFMASGSITSWQIEGGESGSSDRFSFLGSKITVDSGYSHEIKRLLLLGIKIITNLDTMFKKKKKKHTQHFADKGLYNQSYGLPSHHVQMCELDHKEG